MSGFNRHTGKPLSAYDHLRQSVVDILTTPIGSRVMRRDYGSRLYELIDKPANPALKLSVFAAVIDALRLWEPRLIVDRVLLVSAQAGQFVIGIIGRDRLGNDLSFDEIAL